MSAPHPFDRALLDSLFYHSTVAIFLVDVDEDAPLSQRFTYREVNPTLERLTGLTSEWMRGRTPRDLSARTSEEAAHAIEARYQACLEARADITYEEMVPVEEREAWWLTTLSPLQDEHGRIIRLTGFTNEITERKRLELELESERRAQIRFGEQLRHLHRLGTSTYADTAALCDAHLGAGSAMFDLPLGIVSTFGDTPQPASTPLLAETPYIVAAVVSPDGALERGARLALGDMLCAAVAQERATVAYHDLAAEPHLHDHPCYTDLGIAAYLSTPIWVRGALHGTLNFSSPTPRSAPFSKHDVELIELMADSIGHALELAEAEASLMEAKQSALLARDAAEAANHAKTAFLSTMSHEVRTPLNGVLGFAELLRMDPALSAEQRRHADVIIRSGQRLVALINDVLDLASVEAKRLHLERAPVDVHDLVAEHLQVHAARAGAKGLELSYEITPEVPAVLLGDERRLGQVVSNLVSNAIKFTQRGHVRVLADIVPAPAPGAPRLLRVGVEDTGIGISAAHLAQVFEPFFQADSSIARHYEGSGLGLSICHEFIQAMGGEMHAESTPGVGSRFTFTIPLATPPRRREIVTAVPLASLAGRRALVVDDNGTNRDLLSTLLTRWAMHVTTVQDPQEARALFAAEAFDVGLLDYGLEASSGVDLAHALRADGVATPLMLLTSYDLPQVEDTDVFEAVLAKPLDTAALERGLQQVLRDIPQTPRPQSDAPTLWISKGRAAAGHLAPEPYEGLRVIVAEDDPANRTLAHAMLAELGVHAAFVEDGQALLDRLATESFDVVFLDIMMPVLDGLAAAAQIHARLGDARPYLIALTAKAMRTDRAAIAAAGIDGFVAKPFSLRVLADALDAALQTPRCGGERPHADAAVRPG